MTKSDSLFPHLTVAKKVCFGLKNHERDGATKWVEELKVRFDLGPLWHESARGASQAGRPAAWRWRGCWRGRPPLVLLDEPFTAPERLVINELTDALIEWQATIGFTLIAVDHRPDILERLAAAWR
jgi:ABC-type sulfate/molybdate transport systems ATPase subunit